MRQEIETIGTLSDRIGLSRGFGGAVRFAVERSVGLLLAWQQRARERHQLATMDEYGLKDLGLSKADVAREADKPFWQG